MGGTPQLPRNMGDASGFINWCKWVEGKISFILEKLNNPFANTGLSVPAPGTTQVDGNLHVATGNLLVDGSTTINGPLVLPNASVNDAALVNPATFGSGGGSVLGFPLSTSMVVVASASIPIPTGFTRALIHCTVNATAQNTTASTDYMYVEAYVQTSPGGLVITGGQSFAEATAGSWANAAASCQGSPTSIGTGFILVGCAVKAGTVWASSASNIANVDATITFLR